MMTCCTFVNSVINSISTKQYVFLIAAITCHFSLNSSIGQQVLDTYAGKQLTILSFHRRLINNGVEEMNI